MKIQKLFGTGPLRLKLNFIWLPLIRHQQFFFVRPAVQPILSSAKKNKQ
jgi:hypothetical protein